jgi:hypothetical protein
VTGVDYPGGEDVAGSTVGYPVGSCGGSSRSGTALTRCFPVPGVPTPEKGSRGFIGSPEVPSSLTGPAHYQLCCGDQGQGQRGGPRETLTRRNSRDVAHSALTAPASPATTTATRCHTESRLQLKGLCFGACSPSDSTPCSATAPALVGLQHHQHDSAHPPHPPADKP